MSGRVELQMPNGQSGSSSKPEHSMHLRLKFSTTDVFHVQSPLWLVDPFHEQMQCCLPSMVSSTLLSYLTDPIEGHSAAIIAALSCNNAKAWVGCVLNVPIVVMHLRNI